MLAEDIAESYCIEDRVMQAGFHSCFGCVHHDGDRRICRQCSVLSPKWEENERWRLLHTGPGG